LVSARICNFKSNGYSWSRKTSQPAELL